MAELNRFKPRENRLADVEGFAFGCAYEDGTSDAIWIGLQR